jgi:phospholipid transport system substrate-binding protein
MAVTEVEAMCNPNFGLNQRPGRLRRTIIVFAGLTAVAIAAVRPAAAADAVSRADMAPDALVQSVSTEVLDAIRSDPALHKGDVERLQKLIDDKVAPYVDFERMTRLSVGRGWRTATPEQRQALMREFRTLLVRTYSGALSRVTDHQVKMRPFRAQPTDTDVVVRSLVAPSAGEPIQLDYRLEKTDNGWKIYDVTILGVSLVENFRNSFASEINQNGVDGLIKALAERNKQLAAGSGKS